MCVYEYVYIYIYTRIIVHISSLSLYIHICVYMYIYIYICVISIYLVCKPVVQPLRGGGVDVRGFYSHGARSSLVWVTGACAAYASR